MEYPIVHLAKAKTPITIPSNLFARIAVTNGPATKSKSMTMMRLLSKTATAICWLMVTMCC